VKIGFDAKRLFNNFTGLGNYSRFLVDALSDYYPENDYSLYTPKIQDHPETEKYLNSNRFKVRQPQGRAALFSSLWRSYSLGNVATHDGVQLYHGLSNELPLTKPGRLKTVLTVHDLIFKRFPQYYNPFDVQIYSWKLARACASADLIVAISQQTASDLQEFLNVDQEKIRVVYQGCHVNFEQIVPREMLVRVQAKYNLPDRFVLCVGTLEERKNSALLVRALTNVKEKIHVVMVGKPTAYVKKLRNLIDVVKLGHRIHFLHQVSFHDLPAIYRLAELFVYPSLFEGFGIPILEAIVCGVPVITSRGSCFEEAGGPATRYVNPTNPEELAVQINELLSNDALRKDMIARSKEYSARFEPAVISRQMMGVYNELVK
jgi:glycosyltransferase involved in cell wall biosynthesis